ncbi:unnamed protein product [Acanthosepion pharaonis]|uniref:Uncharacterized protein n=1 Tax=Acanthosepion pharaonis TaxID=158019 RepID=A0A812DEV1_ACAPH|nr:unnamed protein product [Sepia pharaonis]
MHSYSHLLSLFLFLSLLSFLHSFLRYLEIIHSEFLHHSLLHIHSCLFFVSSFLFGLPPSFSPFPLPSVLPLPSPSSFLFNGSPLSPPLSFFPPPAFSFCSSPCLLLFVIPFRSSPLLPLSFFPAFSPSSFLFGSPPFVLPHFRSFSFVLPLPSLFCSSPAFSPLSFLFGSPPFFLPSFVLSLLFSPCLLSFVLPLPSLSFVIPFRSFPAFSPFRSSPAFSPSSFLFVLLLPSPSLLFPFCLSVLSLLFFFIFHLRSHYV